jgi:hypothetical protein
MMAARGPGRLFQLTAFATTVFVISVLAMVATLFGDPEAPVNVWINRHMATVLLAEIVAIAVFGFAAMAWDQWTTPRPPDRSEQRPLSTTGSHSEN